MNNRSLFSTAAAEARVEGEGCDGDWKETARRVQAMVEDPTTTAADIERVITADPVLMQKVLQTAATGYAPDVAVHSVRRAVVLLGTRRLYNLAEAQRLWREAP